MEGSGGAAETALEALEAFGKSWTLRRLREVREAIGSLLIQDPAKILKVFKMDLQGFTSDFRGVHRCKTPGYIPDVHSVHLRCTTGVPRCYVVELFNLLRPSEALTANGDDVVVQGNVRQFLLHITHNVTLGSDLRHLDLQM